MKLDLHPTVKLVKKKATTVRPAMDAAKLRALCLEAGADDVGFVALDRDEVRDQRDEILSVLPGAKTLVSFVVRMNRDDIRSPARSMANLEFHHTNDAINDVGRAIVRALLDHGHRAVLPSAGFPMEMDRFPGKTWLVSHKPIAVAAGLGAMGIHRNVIHPQFGNFILLGTVVTDLAWAADEASTPLDYNPCLECKLCVAACPVGAIGSDGHFDFSACYTHNYREFMGGFTDWVENIADAANARDYRARVSDSESASMWQSLSFGANYKAAYCLAVCPAGEDVIGPFLSSRKDFTAQVVRPLQDKVEPIYVTAKSDAEAYVAKRFPHKRIRRVNSGLRVNSIEALIRGMPLRFQRGQSDGLAARYHFSFHGSERVDLTVDIRDHVLTIERGLAGEADVHVTADAEVWLATLRRDKSLFWALLTRRVRVRGKLTLLRRFGACFP
ncbi:SCP2 sterol-binding domain-containing protein [Pendulispora brunnea]|uniref:SCP2 sterol-binding domain-containing protein n=1 Tax=Pendulispora brunnea TaxID=2905690 RepID=A0ABZ2KJ57_9BACT